MEADMALFRSSHPKQSFIDTIFAYDTRTLEQTNDIDISRFVIALSQYLIYFKSKFNETKMFITQKQRLLEVSISQIITEEDLKKFKTKKEARAHIIYNNASLNKVQLDIDVLHDEVIVLEGIDKTVSELIAAFKRELTRRENELYQRRHSS
jgi:hypothetical protein